MAHVIWDWNGTLLDDLPIVVTAVNACLRSQGAVPIDVAGYRRRFLRPLTRFYEDLLGRPVDQEFLGELDDVFQGAYRDGFEAAELNPEAMAAVMGVAVGGGTQSIASMLAHDMLVPAVTRFGLDHQMVVLDGNRGAVGDTKEQRMLDHVALLVEMIPDIDRLEMTVVGDIADDAVAARAAGTRCVLYDGGSQPRRVLEAQGVPVVSSLLDAVAIAEAGVGPADTRPSGNPEGLLQDGE